MTKYELKKNTLPEADPAEREEYRRQNNYSQESGVRN